MRDSIRYRAGAALRAVIFFDIDVQDERDFQPSDEVAKLKWLAPGRSLRRLDHPLERDGVAETSGISPKKRRRRLRNLRPGNLRRERLAATLVGME